MPWQQKLTDDADQPLRPFLILDFVEWEGPLCESWPTPAQREIFGNGTRDAAQAHDIIARFATRAFRQPVAIEEIERYTQLVEAEMKAGKAFEPAVKDVYKRQTLWSSTSQTVMGRAWSGMVRHGAAGRW